MNRPALRRLLGSVLAGSVLAGAVLAAAVSSLSPAAPPGPRPVTTAAIARSQQTPADPVDLRIASVTPSVPPRGTFDVRFDPTDVVPPGSELQVRFHRPITGRTGLRERVARIADGASPGDVVRRPVSVPDGLLGNPLAGWSVSIPITDVDDGNPFEIVLPTDGIVPVSLDLIGPDGSGL